MTKTTTGVNVTASQFETLPTARTFQQLTTLAPGVTLEMGDHDTRFATSPNVGASSAPENNYIIDGLSATDPRFGTSGTNLTMNFVQEVQVMTGGYGAEYGRSTGGVFNVVTKSGGNDFHGDVFTYYRNKDWSPNDVVRRRNKETTTFFNGDTNADFGASLGGPIVRDKLWFFLAADPTRRTTYIGGAVTGGVAAPSAGQKYDTDSNIYAGKLTFSPSANHTLVLTAFGDPTTQSGWLGLANSDPGAATRARPHRQPQRRAPVQRRPLAEVADRGERRPPPPEERARARQRHRPHRPAADRRDDRPVRVRRLPAQPGRQVATATPTSSSSRTSWGTTSCGTGSTSSATTTTPTCTSCGTATSATAARAAATTSRAATTR